MNTSKLNRRNALKNLMFTTATFALPAISMGKESKKPNVLFIAVDDLRPQLGCYGHKQMHSPNIDKLAGQGIQFNRSFCNVPVCGASRASLMTGSRPTRDRFLGYSTWAEKDLPGVTSLPEHFKKHGYHTISNGKIFHHTNDCREGWSEDPWRPRNEEGNWRDYQLEENKQIADESSNGRGPAYEKADVPDEAYFDGKIMKKSVSDLRRLAKKDEPFFLAVGFLKPHLPFNAPSKYWDLYDRDKIDMADNPFRPKNAPDAAMHNWGELRNYYDIPSKGSLSDEKARTLVHGYYACVSYTDAMIGKLMDELDALNLSDNTIIILWGDHGWNLREHGLWCKHCNFKTSLQAPILVRAPGMKEGIQTDALTEFVDIYPSLCELCELPLPEHLDGKSFVPLMKNPDQEWKKAVFSRYYAGDSVKTDRYLYTEWRDKKGDVYARMLYDHKNDPKENVNIAENPENKALVSRLSNLLKKQIQKSLN